MHHVPTYSEQSSWNRDAIRRWSPRITNVTSVYDAGHKRLFISELAEIEWRQTPRDQEESQVLVAMRPYMVVSGTWYFSTEDELCVRVSLRGQPGAKC